MMPYSGGDEFPCIVADVGSYATKMGFAGEDSPRAYFRSTTAVLRDSSSKTVQKRSYDFFTRPLKEGDSTATSGNGSSDTDEGGSLDGPNWDVSNPVDPTTGLLYDTSSTSSEKHISSTTIKSKEGTGGDLQAIDNSYGGCECYSHLSDYLTHGYETALCINKTSDSPNLPLFFIEKSYNPPPIRQKLLEVIFEEQNYPATFLGRDAVCACYAVGRTSGTVVDIGHHQSVVTPVYDGYVESKGVIRGPVGGNMMDEAVLQNLDSLYQRKKFRQQGSSSAGSSTKSGQLDHVMPLYQTRTPNNARRSSIFHDLARLDMARISRESGCSAGVATFGYASLESSSNNDSTGAGSTIASSSATSSQQEGNEIYQQYATAPKTQYKLPDGTVLDIPQTKRFDVAEIIFGKDGTSVKKRTDATAKMKRRMQSILQKSLSSSSSNSKENANAITELEERLKRKRSRESGISNSSTFQQKQKQELTSHAKLVKACYPYISKSIGELSSSSVPAMVCDSAFKCERDQQPQLLGNVILCGGGACLSTSVLSSTSFNSDHQDGIAMTERLREEVEAIVHTHTPGWKVKVLSPGLTERSICSWLGGSILASLGSFHEMWITKQDYEEYGAAIVNRKCP